MHQIPLFLGINFVACIDARNVSNHRGNPNTHMIPTNNTIIQNNNINDLIALKPKQFRELPDALLIEIAPVLLAWSKEVEAYAHTLKSTSIFCDSCERSKAFAFSYVIRDRADIAKRLPAQRKEKSEKEARKNAREAKVETERDTAILVAPSVELIMKHYDSTIKEMIKRAFDNHVVRHNKYINGHKEAVAQYGEDAGKINSYMRNTTIIEEHKYSWMDMILKKCESTIRPYEKFNGYITAEEASKLYMNCAVKFVNEIFGAFAYKIAVRSIERHYKATSIKRDTLVNVDGGNQTIWEGSIITTHFKSGSYKFKTTLKWNRSKYDKHFIQFPTVEICGENENQNDLQDWNE